MTTINPRRAGQLIIRSGPRFYFETNNATLSGAQIDHPLWSMRAARYLVHLDVVGLTPEDAASTLIANVQAHKAIFRSSHGRG